MNKEKIIEQYVQRAILYGESLEKGENSRLTNKHHKYTLKYYELLRKLGRDGETELLKLLNHPSIYVRFCTAGLCRTLNENKSKQVLQEIKQTDTIVGITAAILLDYYDLN